RLSGTSRTRSPPGEKTKSCTKSVPAPGSPPSINLNSTIEPGSPLSSPSALPMKVSNGACGGAGAYAGSSKHNAKSNGLSMCHLLPGQLISRLLERTISQWIVNPFVTWTSPTMMFPPPPVIRPGTFSTGGISIQKLGTTDGPVGRSVHALGSASRAMTAAVGGNRMRARISNLLDERVSSYCGERLILEQRLYHSEMTRVSCSALGYAVLSAKGGVARALHACCTP